jgi:glycerophosphoryl diester phosphodiesterase
MNQSKKPVATWMACCILLLASQSNLTAEKPQESIFADLSLNEIMIAAHRGGYESDKADRAPENSVANIRNCQQKGYKLYETDIQRTRDGHFVIMHDETIDRETNGHGMVKDLTLAELKRLRKRYRDGSVSQETIATLDEFLEEGAGRTIFKADLKPGVSQYFEQIMEVVVQRKATRRIIFRVRYAEADRFARLKSEGVPYAPSLLMFRVSSKKQVDDIKQRFNPLTIQVNLDKKAPTKPKSIELIQYAASKDLLVETHAEGKTDDWTRLIQAGVRMFHTGKPAIMKSFLQARSSTP